MMDEVLNIVLNIALIPSGKAQTNYSPSNYRQIVRQTGLFNLGVTTSLSKRKHCIQTT